MGTNNLKSGGTRYAAKQLIPHEEYFASVNDIALIQIDGEIHFDDKVQPIKYSKKYIEEGAELQISGFGQPNVSEKISQVRKILKFSFSLQFLTIFFNSMTSRTPIF